MGVLDVDSTGLFVSAIDQNAQMESFAQRGLTQALELFTAKRYAEAIPAFKRVIGMSPRSATALNAYDYLAKSYLSLEDKDTRSAIATYRQSLRLAPDRAATHLALGNLHFEAQDYAQAQAAYAQAVKLDGSASNRYSLGQALLELGRYAEAEAQFRKVHEMSPRKPDGSFGLGLVYARQGRAQEAISAFQRAIDTKPDFWFSYEELGYVLTDEGEFDRARELVDILAPKAPELAATLSRYLTQQTPPELVSVYSTSTFLYTLGPRTPVSALGDYLTEADSQRSFSMVFQFSKRMDAQSVENVLNWSISRSLDTGRADGYNFSLPLPATEVGLPANPSSVEYDAEMGSATVHFSVRQNAAANGTIDPYHIKFKFRGVDAEGRAMNSQADEYTGFSGFA